MPEKHDPHPEGFTHDVFISYSSSDSEVVERIVKRMRGSGLKIWRDVTDIPPGDVFIRTIEDGLEHCQIMVAFISHQALRSDWVKMEHEIEQMLIAKEMGGEKKKRKLISVLIEDVSEELPLFLKRYNYIDCKNIKFLDSYEWVLQVDNLVKSINFGLDHKKEENQPIPIIIFSMKENEAKELVSEEIFKGDVKKTDKKRYKSFMSALSSHNITKEELPSYYGDSRDDWSPRITNPRRIREIIEFVVEKINQQPNLSQRLEPVFLSDEFIEDSQIIMGLRGRKCILVIDSISMFHPGLNEKLRDSGFISGINPDLCLIVIPPVNHNVIPVYEFLESRYQSMMKNAFNLFSAELNLGYEFGIGNIYSLQHWLASSLLNIANAEITANDAKFEKMAALSKGEDKYQGLIWSEKKP